MRAVGYVRVSTATQAAGDSPAAQREAVERWAAREGHELVGTFSDNGLSGTVDETGRPGLLDALDAIEAGDAGALAVHRLDRLARALHVQEAVLGRVWAAGGRVFEAVGGGEVLADDPADPMRTFVRQVMGAAAQLERGMIVARLHSGRRRAAARGGYVGGPRLHRRYGFELAAGAYVPVASERAAIDLMRQLRDRGRTLAAICRELERRGVPGPTGNGWSVPTVSKILRRPG